MIEAPMLVIVTGAPGSGKTTLSRILARQLKLPLLTKDQLKIDLADVLGAPNRAATQRLTAIAFRQLFGLVDEQLELGIGVVLEANLYRGQAEPDVRPLLPRARSCRFTARPLLKRAPADSRFAPKNPSAIGYSSTMNGWLS